jgi:hypothetical protein
MKESHRQSFRWAPHAIGLTSAKPKDYEQPSDPIEAPSHYALWLALKDGESPLQVGDVIEADSSDLRIYKYVGFEEVQWQVPEVKTPAAQDDPGPDPPLPAEP